MDTFIDKLAQKRNAQEMIRANMTAEAAKMEQMQNQMKAYEEQMQSQMKAYEEQTRSQMESYKAYEEQLRSQAKTYEEQLQNQVKAYEEQMQNQQKVHDEFMQEMRQVNLRTAENAAEAQNALKECMVKLEAMQTDDARNALQECMVKLEAMQTDDAQKAPAEQMWAQLTELLEEKFKQSDDFLHKENVKVYRNVQAVVTEELNKQTEGFNKQTEELKSDLEKGRSSKALLPISILILLGIVADLVVQLLSITIKF